MRYHVHMTDGKSFATDFETAPTRALDPEGGEGGMTLMLCREVVSPRFGGYGLPHYRWFNDAHVLTIEDTDCG